MVAIELHMLVDRLEALLIEGRTVPFSDMVLVDRERCFDLLNQMRTSVPEEIKKAQRIQQERDRIIAQANEEAERIVALARERRTQMVAEHEIVRLAQEEADRILAEAQREAEELRAGADAYVYEVLKQLEGELVALLRTVRNGLETLRKEGVLSEPESQEKSNPSNPSPDANEEE